MLLPVPTIAATLEMFTITRVAGFFHQWSESADGCERTADVGGENSIDQVVGQRIQIVMRNHAGEAGRVYQDIAAAIVALDHGGGFANQGRFQHRYADGAMADAGQGLQHDVRLFGLAVVADDDFRAGGGQALGHS